ncbi:MAG: D-aminoacyl-tRNA deacylase [Burkholderiales bacterium]
MIGLLQRVSSASVEVDGATIACIEQGLLVLVGVERMDTPQSAERLLQRLVGYRVFSDAQGKMNLSVREVQGGLLLVPQFTLAADTRKGTRPSFSPATTPERGRELFEYLVQFAMTLHPRVAAGRFAAQMQVALVNDGPVTFWMRVD